MNNPLGKMAKLFDKLATKGTDDSAAADFRKWAQQLEAIASEMEQSGYDGNGMEMDCIDQLREIVGGLDATAQQLEEEGY